MDDDDLASIDCSSSIEYHKMLLTKTNRIVTTDSKITMRDNSCILYKKGESQSIGIVHKIIHTPSTNRTVIIVYPLKPSHNKLCTDDVTNAGIDTHICQLLPLKRYVDTLSTKKNYSCILLQRSSECGGPISSTRQTYFYGSDRLCVY